MGRIEQKVMAALAEPTRHAIYEYVCSVGASVTVTHVAERFSIHPNVARLHLNKLVECDLLTVTQERSGKGGRPGNRYASTKRKELVVAASEGFRLLAELLIRSVCAAGATDVAAQVGRSFGEGVGRGALLDGKGETEPGSVTAQAFALLGSEAHLQSGETGDPELVLSVCGVNELAMAYPDQVCHLCQGVAEGVAQACGTQQAQVERVASLPKGDPECRYRLPGPGAT